MKIKWKQVTGCQQEQPKAVDTVSSPDTVYLRRNIKSCKIKMGDATIDGYTYEEAQLTIDEYEEYKASMDNPAVQEVIEKVATLEESVALILEMMMGGGLNDGEMV